MTIQETLNVWKEICGANWSLYRETLLCANGLDAFPRELEYVQVTVEDPDRIQLPAQWVCEKKDDQMIFRCQDEIVLTADICPSLQFGEVVRCGGVEYPAFDGYRQYLARTYGDYENGLTDEIGVGLTAGEKMELKAHQQRCIQALKFLQELSQEFDLRYYLIAGSVLGAVRHGGFIPWDDDVDVGVRIEDLDRLEKLAAEYLSQRLPEGFTLEQPEPNRPYARMFSKICYEGRCCIDLWPLVPTKNEGFGPKFSWFYAKLLSKTHFLKVGAKVDKHAGLARAMGIFFNDRQIMNMARRNERRYAGKDAPAYINLYSVYSQKKETLQRRWLDTPAVRSFEGILVPVVGCTEEYLTHLYGDYMAKPAPWKRASRHADRF